MCVMVYLDAGLFTPSMLTPPTTTPPPPYATISDTPPTAAPNMTFGETLVLTFSETLISNAFDDMNATRLSMATSDHKHYLLDFFAFLQQPSFLYRWLRC